jgi:molybdenum cofactor cytidylyltransferase
LGRDETPKLAGLILAGGEGSRFGGPKAWARLPDGRSFLEACAMTLREAGASPLVANLPPGSADPGIEGLQALPLPERGLDMFTSLLIGFRCISCDPNWQKLAVLPVDHPLVRPATVRKLAAARGAAAVPCYDAKHGHPVCLSRGLVDQLKLGELEGRNLREALRAVARVDVRVDDPGVIANCNTPAALSEALRTVHRRS